MPIDVASGVRTSCANEEIDSERTESASSFAGLARSLGFPDDAVVTIPVSALVGDNVVDRSEHTPWYDGPTLLGHLESVPVLGPEVNAPFRMPVKHAYFPDHRTLHKLGEEIQDLDLLDALPGAHLFCYLQGPSSCEHR